MIIESIIPREGEAAMLRNILTRVPTTLRVFTNDVTLNRRVTYRMLKEPTSRFYTPVSLDPGGWKVTEGDPVSNAEYSPVSLVFGGPIGRIFGYYVTLQKYVLWVHRIPDDAPFFARIRDDELKITPRLRFGGKPGEVV